jgi:hypothetical protein
MISNHRAINNEGDESKNLGRRLRPQRFGKRVRRRSRCIFAVIYSGGPDQECSRKVHLALAEERGYLKREVELIGVHAVQPEVSRLQEGSALQQRCSANAMSKHCRAMGARRSKLGSFGRLATFPPNGIPPADIDCDGRRAPSLRLATTVWLWPVPARAHCAGFGRLLRPLAILASSLRDSRLVWANPSN